MTDDLKDKFTQLVADPPPPSAVPSEAVFARVRAVRRRRTATAVTVAAAAVVAIVVAAGNLSDIEGRPPVSGTPAPVITGPPTIKPTIPALAAAVALKPVVTGRTVTMRVTVSGTVLVPTADGANLPADTTFLDLSAGTTYDFGDGYTNGSDGGGVLCSSKSKKRTTGRETYVIPESHTYTKPGTYTFRYSVQYCGTKGWFTTSKTTQVVIR